MTAMRSERTRVVADLAWLGGLIQVVLGLALLASPEPPIVAATLSIVAGTVVVIAGSMLLRGVRASWRITTFAFVLSIGAATYAIWVATPYWWSAVLSGALACAGLVLQWTDHLPRPPRPARRTTR